MTIPSSWFEEQPERLISSIQEIREEESDFGRQIIVEILPLGESVVRPLFFSAKNPTSPRSKWQKWLKTWKDVGVTPSTADDLLGTIVMFEQVPRTYKIDGETIESVFWKPIKVYDSEADAIPDMDRLQQGATPSEEDLEVGQGHDEDSAGLTDELVAKAKGVYQALGEDDEKFMKVAESSYNLDEEGLENLLEAIRE